MEIKVNNSIDKKTEYVFSAIMFFAPLIKRNIKENQKLSQDDKIFITWYIKLWYANIALLVLALVFGVIQFRFGNLFLKRISIGFLVILALSLIVWTILAAIWKNINFHNDIKSLETKADFDKIFYFIPIYNIYIWYKRHQFEWENATIKCGILLLTLFTLSAIFIRNFYVNIIILIFTLFVIVCSVSWIAFWGKWTNILNKSFLKNPEEIWWYFSGIFFSFFNKKWVKENIEEQKKQFEFLFKIDNKQIILEYVLMLFLCIFGIYIWIKYGEYSLLTWDVLIILRYWLMIIKWKHLPHLPLFRWITNIFFNSKIIKNE